MAGRKSIPWPLQGERIFGPVSSRSRWVHDGDDINTIQEAVGVEPSGSYDEDTRRAVVKYQQENDLPVTGTVDRKLWTRLTRGKGGE